MVIALLSLPNNLLHVNNVGIILFFILDKSSCVIKRFVVITKQFILSGYCKENLHTDKLAGAE